MAILNYSESKLSREDAYYNKVIPAGDGWYHVIPKGHIFRITDLEGNQAVDTLFYNNQDRADRFSSMQTIQSQGNLFLSTGTRLMTNRGNCLLTIVADTCGRHDALGGACSAESNSVRYALDKRTMHNCRDTFLLQLSKAGEGMTKRDLSHNINFFMNVPVTPEGELTFADGVSEPGKYVELKAEIDVLCLISNCPQLNNPCNAYNPTPVAVSLWKK